MTEKVTPDRRKLPEDLRAELLLMTSSINRALTGGSDPKITNLEVRDDYHMTTNHRGIRAKLTLIKHTIGVRGGCWVIWKGEELSLGELLTNVSQHGSIEGIYRHLVKSTTSYEIIDLKANQLPVDYLPILVKLTENEITVANLVANQTIDYLLSEVSRLNAKVEELELRPPELGGTAFLAAKQHWEETMPGEGT